MVELFLYVELRQAPEPKAGHFFVGVAKVERMHDLIWLTPEGREPTYGVLYSHPRTVAIVEGMHELNSPLPFLYEPVRLKPPVANLGEIRTGRESDNQIPSL
jgi:hypothetical protein